MSHPFSPATETDSYKLGHVYDYPENTTSILTNMTARASRVKGVDYTIVFAIQPAIQDLADKWYTGFFSKPKATVLAKYQARVDGFLGPGLVTTEHLAKLHDLGYLPLRFCALPEGTKVPLRVPFLTVEATHPEHAWLSQYIETTLSANTWHPMTSATSAYYLRELADYWADKTSDIPEFVDFQMHDFSYRGQVNDLAAARSGAGHLLSFAGTDTLPALDFIEEYYGPTDRFLGGSVPATEHSVMCTMGPEGEFETYKRLITEKKPGSIKAIVSDTYDFWKVVTEYLPALKDKIMEHEGKIVIRPDSGNPVDILCGFDGNNGWYGSNHVRTPEEKGLIECLFEVFGGEINSKGYKQLDPHIGAIYGDSIFYDRAEEIFKRLAAKGFASTNTVLGIGSFFYQHVTRDTYGFAMKATHAVIDGVPTDLFKDPATDRAVGGSKKSARGRLTVVQEKDGTLVLVEQAPEYLEKSTANLLKPVWEDGNFVRWQTWDEIVDRVGKRVLR